MRRLLSAVAVLLGCAPLLALHLQDVEGTVYNIDPWGVGAEGPAEGVAVRVGLPYARPSFRMLDDGDILAAVQTADGVHLLRLDATGETYHEAGCIPGVKQPLYARDGLFFVMDHRGAEELWFASDDGTRERLVRFRELGGYAVVERGGRFEVVFGAVRGRDEMVFALWGTAGAWSVPRAVSPAGRHRACPDMVVDRQGRLVITYVGIEDSERVVFVAREEPDGTFRERMIKAPGTSAVFPLLLSADPPIVLWESSTDRGLRVLAARTDGSGPVRLVGSLDDSRSLVKLGERVFWDGAARLDPNVEKLELLPGYQNQFAAAQTQPSPSLDVYVGFGDSIMEGNKETSSDNNCFYPYLRRELALQYGYAEVYNGAVGGENTAEGLRRIDRVLRARVPGILFMMEGTNDIPRGQQKFTSADTAHDLELMVQKCRDVGALPIVSTLIPRTRRDPYDPRNHDTNRWNRAIRKMLAENGVAMMSMYRAFIRAPDWEDELMFDSVHPNKKGYELMGEKWLESIVAHRPVPVPPPAHPSS